MPLDRDPGHPFDAPVDHADGRWGRLPVSGAVAHECTHGGRAQGEGKVAGTDCIRARQSRRTIQAAPDARTRSSRVGL